MQMWPQVTEAMKGLAKAMFKPAVVESVDGKKVTVRLPANTPMKRAQEQIKTVEAALTQVCGGKFVVTLTQADPTSGIQRPVVEEVPQTIDKVVEADPFAAIDINETVVVHDAVDPMLEAFQSEFPGGTLVDDETPNDDDGGKPKSSRGKK